MLLVNPCGKRDKRRDVSGMGLSTPESWDSDGLLVISWDYHLVMTNGLPWKDPPFLNGKASISMSHFPWLC